MHAHAEVSTCNKAGAHNQAASGFIHAAACEGTLHTSVLWNAKTCLQLSVDVESMRIAGEWMH